MARTGIHSTDARRYVRIAQFAGVGLGVMAAALWAMDLPGLSSTLPSKPAPRSDLGSGNALPAITQVARIDDQAAGAIQERLESALRRPKPPPPTDPPKTEQKPEVPSTGGPAWRYLGAIRESTRTLGLVSIDGNQKIVFVGSMVTLKTPAAEGRPESVNYQAKVTDVQPDFIEIEDGGGKPRRIELEVRTASVSWVKNMPTAVTGNSAAGAGAALSAEMRQRLAAGGIDPVAAERARQAALASAAAATGRNRAVPNAPGNTGQVMGISVPNNTNGTAVVTPDKTPATLDANGNTVNNTGTSNNPTNSPGKKKRPNADSEVQN